MVFLKNFQRFKFKSFSHRNRSSDNELSNEFWKIKDRNRRANMAREI